jgi:thiamine biosynthesis lipoprotein
MTRRVDAVMGTVFSVDVRRPFPAAALHQALDDVFAWFRWVDEVFSPYRPDSWVSRLGRGECSRQACPPEVSAVLATCEELRRGTDGYFDVRADPRWPLDPCGYVKGWAAEMGSARLAAAGWGDHCVNAGGDVRTRGRPAPGRRWRVGVAHPLIAGAITVAVDVDDAAVATSGTLERGPHVWDPHRRRAALELASVTVVGSDLGRADAYATAALAMGVSAPAWLGRLARHESLVVDAGGHAWWTPGFAAMAIGLPAEGAAVTVS